MVTVMARMMMLMLAAMMIMMMMSILVMAVMAAMMMMDHHRHHFNDNYHPHATQKFEPPTLKHKSLRIRPQITCRSEFFYRVKHHGGLCHHNRISQRTLPQNEHRINISSKIKHSADLATKSLVATHPAIKSDPTTNPAEQSQISHRLFSTTSDVASEFLFNEVLQRFQA